MRLARATHQDRMLRGACAMASVGARLQQLMQCVQLAVSSACTEVRMRAQHRAGDDASRGSVESRTARKFACLRCPVGGQDHLRPGELLYKATHTAK